MRIVQSFRIDRPSTSNPDFRSGQVTTVFVVGPIGSPIRIANEDADCSSMIPTEASDLGPTQASTGLRPGRITTNNWQSGEEDLAVYAFVSDR
jgi:hypothetical protein